MRVIIGLLYAAVCGSGHVLRAALSGEKVYGSAINRIEGGLRTGICTGISAEISACSAAVQSGNDPSRAAGDRPSDIAGINGVVSGRSRRAQGRDLGDRCSVRRIVAGDILIVVRRRVIGRRLCCFRSFRRGAAAENERYRASPHGVEVNVVACRRVADVGRAGGVAGRDRRGVVARRARAHVPAVKRRRAAGRCRLSQAGKIRLGIQVVRPVVGECSRLQVGRVAVAEVDRVRLRLPDGVERRLERVGVIVVGRRILVLVRFAGIRAHPICVVILARAVGVVSGITGITEIGKIADGRTGRDTELVAEISPVERLIRPRGKFIAGFGEAVGERSRIAVGHRHRIHRAARAAVAVEIQHVIASRPVRIEHLGLGAGTGGGIRRDLVAAGRRIVPAVKNVARTAHCCQRCRRVFCRRADRHHIRGARVLVIARRAAGLGQIDRELCVGGGDAGRRAFVIDPDRHVALERRVQGEGSVCIAAEILVDTGRETIAVFIEQLPDERRARADRY